MAGCSGSDPDLPPVVARLGRIEYRSDTELSACTDAPQRVLARLEAVEAVLGIRGPERIVYVHESDPAHAATWPCPSRDVDCADGNTIYSGSYVRLHEVVHAALSGIEQPSGLLTEGMATVFGLNGVAIPAAPDPWQELIGVPRGTADSRLYFSGAALVSYLYRGYGASELVEFYRRARLDPSATSEVFTDIYGESLDDAWTAAHALASPYVCDGMADDTSLDGSENDTPESACPGGSDDQRHTFSFEAATDLAIDSTYWDASVQACDAHGSPPLEILIGRWQPIHGLQLARWDAGQYFVSRNSLGGGSPDQQSFRARRGSFIGETCSEAIQPLPLESKPDELFISMLPPAEAVLAVEWSGAEALVYSVTYADSWAARWLVCTDCTLLDCSAADTDQPLILAPGVSWIAPQLKPGLDPVRINLRAKLNAE